MNSKRIYIALVIVVILILPYLLSAPWTIFDYVVASIFLVGVGYIFDVMTTKMTSQKKKVFAGACTIVVALYVWAELAVGLFTTLGS
jgi:hypothetical protein